MMVDPRPKRILREIFQDGRDLLSGPRLPAFPATAHRNRWVTHATSAGVTVLDDAAFKLALHCAATLEDSVQLITIFQQQIIQASARRQVQGLGVCASAAEGFASAQHERSIHYLEVWRDNLQRLHGYQHAQVESLSSWNGQRNLPQTRDRAQAQRRELVTQNFERSELCAKRHVQRTQ